jgi:hypothetical protein
MDKGWRAAIKKSAAAQIVPCSLWTKDGQVHPEALLHLLTGAGRFIIILALLHAAGGLFVAVYAQFVSGKLRQPFSCGL